MSDSRAHHPPAIATRKSVSQNLSQGSPVPGRKVRLEALGHEDCRVFQVRCRPAEFVEAAERGVEVCLVEYLSAADHVAFNCENRDPAPLGVKTLLRGLICCVSDDCSGVGQPMHCLDVNLVV